jgi:hypothetical protein
MLFSGFGRPFPRAAGFAALNIVVFLSSAYVVLWWLSVPVQALRAVGFVWCWVVLLWAIGQCFALSVMAMHDTTLLEAEKAGLFLVLGRLPAAMVMAMHIAALIGLVALPFVGGMPALTGLSVFLTALGLFAHAALVHTHTTHWLLEQVGAGREADGAEPPPDIESGE